MISLDDDADGSAGRWPPVPRRDGLRVVVARESGKPVARCAAMSRGRVGIIGWFEADDHPAAVRAMLHEAAAWLRAQGAGCVSGPIDGDTWHRYRVNAGPFDAPPFLLEPVNPPYYDALWRAAGFEVVERYSSKRIADVTSLAARLEPMYERALARGYRIRPFDRARIAEELTLIWRLSLEIFRGNPFYTGISLDAFLELYAGIERLLVPDLVLFAETTGGDVAGFIFAYPDTAGDTVDYKTIGVAPRHRRGHVAWALLHRAYRGALTMSRPVANHCLMREENASQSMDAGEGVPFRFYNLYALPQ